MHHHERIIQHLLCQLYRNMLEDFDSELERTWDEVIQKSFDEDERPAAIDIQRHPLIEAVIQGNVSSVREMISNGQNVNEVVQGLGTPLIWAAIQGHDDIVHELLEAGADADLNEYSDVNARENAIVLHIGLVESLQEELATTTLDSVNESLVCRAICEHRRIIGRLQGRYDDFTSYGNTALMYAAMNGHGSIVRDLLLVGADVNMLGSDGLSAVWYAAIFRHVDVLKDLICAGAMVGGSSSMLHVLPFIPGSIGWIAAFLVGFDNVSAGKQNPCNAIRDRGLRRMMRRFPRLLKQNIQRTLPAQLAWPPIPKLLRAIQCIRLFRRMINCVPVPRLEARNSPNDAAQLRELLFMVDARTDSTNDTLVGHFQALNIPNELVLLVREAYLEKILVQILQAWYDMEVKCAYGLIEIVKDPNHGIMRILQFIDRDNIQHSSYIVP